jgi:hypothetical protein
MLIVFDDETANLLNGVPNKSHIVREATKLYLGDILTDTREGLRTSYRIIAKSLKDIDGKLDYIDRKISK